MNNSETTSTNWLLALKQFDGEAWNRLADLYGPLVYGLARAQGLGEADARDVAQVVFQKVFAGIGEFRRDRPGDSFRGWLRTITRNAVRDHFRRLARRTPAAGGTDTLQQLSQIAENLSDDSLPVIEFSQADVFRRATELFGANQHKTAWQAFWQTEIEGRPVKEVAAELGVTEWAIYKGRARVLKELRKHFGEFLD